MKRPTLEKVNKALLDLIIALNVNANAYDDDLSDTWKNVLEKGEEAMAEFTTFLHLSPYNDIQIIDWAGNILFEGNYNSPKVDRVLKANRCKCKQCKNYRKNIGEDYCADSEHSGYLGDFHVQWSDKNRNDNVYEFINY